VLASRALSGDAPFDVIATASSKDWQFEPATRAGVAIAVKIRFAVHFEPPASEPAPQPNEPAGPPQSAAPARGQKPATYSGTQEIFVIGKREPIRHTLGHADVHDLPGAFGDPYRAIEALPGVVPIASGLPYFYVRGAPPGNVGYFFDGIPVPYLYHFAAGPGVLQPAFVDHVDLYPGAYPARYGRFAGAIVAGEMTEPGYRFHGEASVRLIDSGAMVEAPFAGGRGSVMVGGRFSYTGLVISLVAPDVSVGYWDYQARARYDLSPKDIVEIFGFGSGDYSTFTDENIVVDDDGSLRTERHEATLVDIGFHRLDLRWDHRLEQGNWRNALMFGRDRTGFADGQINVYDYMVGLRSEYWKQLDPRMKLRAGADLLFESLKQEFTDSSVKNGSGVTDGNDAIEERDRNQEDAARLGFDKGRKDFSWGMYADLVWDVAPRLQITPGLRADLFVSGQRAALGIDPRITAEYTLSKKLKVVHGLALVHQTPSFIGPIPGFKPSLAGGLQKALQHSAGVNYELPAGFSSSLALFHSAFFDMTDLISLLQLEQTVSRGSDDGNRNFNDFLASVERVQYRYPEFPEGLTAIELYEQMIDEELKTFLRKRNGSKFRDADCVMDEKKRVAEFARIVGEPPIFRRQVVEAYFRSTFAAWENYYTKPRPGMVHVGYSPAIGIDADRMVRDFPDIRILHIVRNPFSAYRDTKRRPFPQPLTKYLITWNIYHSTVEMFAKMYPENVRIFRYEDLVDDKRKFMTEASAFIGVPFADTMLYPSWNGVEIKDSIAPWGTVLKSTKDYNQAVIQELSDEERKQIAQGTAALARHFGYDRIDYLSPLYRAE